MTDADRFRLLAKYRTPRCRVGQRVRCQVRGTVVIVALSDASISWRLCKAGTWLVSVVFKDLAKALRRESAPGSGVSACPSPSWQRATRYSSASRSGAAAPAAAGW